MVLYEKLIEYKEEGHERKRSSLIEDTTPEAKRYLDAVAKGKLDEVTQLISNRNFDINQVDSMGNSALHIALQKNNEAMVKLLLEHEIDVFDCLFYAITYRQLNNVELIMNRLANIDRRYSFIACRDSTKFPHYMTPLMCAAQHGAVEIMDFLVSEGHPMIPVPHEPQCLCEKCMRELREKDTLELAHDHLEVYRALCSPAYILKYSSDDPVLMVFYRVHELRLMADANRVFIRKYQELIEKTEQIAAQLVGLCRTSDEVKVLLSVKEGTTLTGKFIFPRLILALDYKQRYFVSQINIQAAIQTAWHEDWYQWNHYSSLRCVFHIAGRVVTLPFLAFCCLLLPSSTLAKFYSIPANRFISSLAAYILFLFLLYKESDRDKKGQKRYDILNDPYYKVLIIIYVLSHMINSVRMWMFRGSERFFTFAWNWYDLTNQLLFVLTFAFWALAFLTLYWEPDIERKYWDHLDPQLVAESIFVVATVMSYIKLLFYIQIDSTLGPMQVSIGKMTTDFSHFIVIFAIVIGSFTAAMCHLYEYYDGMKQIDPESQTESRQESSFVSPYDTFKILFWGLFGMSSQESGTVVIENISGESSELNSINSHDFTEAVGTTLFSAYIVLTVIVLLNMLIAAISNTFQNVSENVDYEWVFGRTKVYLIYMAQTIIPPPLSVLPSCVGESAVRAFFQKVFMRSKSKPKEDIDKEAAEEVAAEVATEEVATEEVATGEVATGEVSVVTKEKEIVKNKEKNKESIVEIEDESSFTTNDPNKEYKELMAQLIQRYFSQAEGSPEDESKEGD